MKIPFYKSTSCKLEFTKHVNCDRFTYCKHKFAFACKFSTFPVLCFKEKTWRSCIIWGNLGGGMGLQEYNKPYHDKLWATDCVIHFRVEIFFLRKWKILLTNFEIVTYCFHNCNLRSGDFFFFWSQVIINVTISTFCRGDTSIAFILNQLTNNEVEWKEVKCEFAAGAG